MGRNDKGSNSAAAQQAAAAQAAEGAMSTASGRMAAVQRETAESMLPKALTGSGASSEADASAEAGKLAARSAARWLDVIGYEELPAGAGKTVRIGELELALFRLTSGKVHVVQNRCPHKDGVLAEGIVSGEFVFCPLHDRKIHVPSGEVQKPDTGCVHTYDAKVEDGRVLIAVPAEALLAG